MYCIGYEPRLSRLCVLPKALILHCSPYDIRMLGFAGFGGLSDTGPARFDQERRPESEALHTVHVYCYIRCSSGYLCVCDDGRSSPCLCSRSEARLGKSWKDETEQRIRSRSPEEGKRVSANAVHVMRFLQIGLSSALRGPRQASSGLLSQKSFVLSLLGCDDTAL